MPRVAVMGVVRRAMARLLELIGRAGVKGAMGVRRDGTIVSRDVVVRIENVLAPITGTLLPTSAQDRDLPCWTILAILKGGLKFSIPSFASMNASNP